MELPRELAGWGPILSIFPRDLALALGPLVLRLARTVGPFHAEPQQMRGEPNGFDGFTRRGSYERLLLSEWLLAEEAPIEFVRRAAAGEHTFIRIARQEPASARRSVALFDAGTSQLGGPRIAHLAALIVLARRAESAGTGLLWGIVGSPQQPMQEQVTPASILHLLGARSFAEPTGRDLEEWRSRLGLERPDDAWLIGGKDLALLPGAERWSRLLIRDTYEPGAARLQVTIAGKESGSVSRTATLELPEGRTAARLLRDPFKATPTPLLAAVDSYRPISNLVFVGSSKLVARSANGAIIVYTIPNSPRDKVTQPKTVARNPAYPIIAVTHVKRQLFLLSRYSDRMIRVEMSGGGENNLRGNYTCEFDLPAMPSDDPLPLRPCWYVRGKFGDHSLYLYLKDGTLLSLGPEKGETRIVARNVVDMLPMEKEHWYMGISPKNRLEVTQAGEKAPVLGIPVPQGGRALLGQPRHLYNRRHPLVAVESLNRWSLPNYQEEAIVTPGDATPLGLLVCRERLITPAIAVLRGDRRTVSLINAFSSLELLKETSDISRIALSPLAPELAYTTEHELVVYSIARNETLLRMALQEENRV